MKKRILLWDGNGVASIAFNGNLPEAMKKAKDEDKYLYFDQILKNSKGKYTNALLGMTKTILKISNECGITHSAIVWDVTRNTFRRLIYPDYKGTRKDTLEPLREQIITGQAAFEYCGLYTVKSDPNGPQELMFEGDDWLGTLVEKIKESMKDSSEDYEIVIYTKDKDTFQLADDHVTIWYAMTGDNSQQRTNELLSQYNIDPVKMRIPAKVFPYSPKIIKSECGIDPYQIIDMKALEGDAGDNIPGVKGVGTKTVIPLLQHYGTIDRLYEDIDSKDEKELKEFWKKELYINRSPYKNLTAEASDLASDVEKDRLSARELAFLSKNLATIKRDCPIDNFDIESLQLNIDREKLMRFLTKYELNSIIKNLDSYFTPPEDQEDYDDMPIVLDEQYLSENEPSLYEICDFLEPVKKEKSLMPPKGQMSLM